MSGIQKIIEFILSKETYNKVKDESKHWLFKCTCGNEFSIWDIGGIRYKAKGNPAKYVKCNQCQKKAWMKLIYKQTIDI